ncbi:MAG TPA: TadE/TadG family type IV pilus assembly protein [Tepidisphaeraceae bacterium]|nr:TadE/TadG family type IV pilus assembly protein [Tepidisphaeraceae bacterium]
MLAQTSRLSDGTRRGRRRGNAIVELALTLGILINLSFGMVEFGYYFYVKNSFEGAAREGVRAAIVPGAVTTDVTTAITNSMNVAGYAATQYSVEYQAGTSGSCPVGGTAYSTSPTTITGATTGTPIAVAVYTTWGVVGKGYSPLHFIGTSKVLMGTAVMRKEG